MAARERRRPGGTPSTTRRTPIGRRPGEGRPGGSRPEQGVTHRIPEPEPNPLEGSRAFQSWRRTRSSTQRLAILGAIVVVLGIMLVPTLRAYLSQRDDIAALQEQVKTQEQTVSALTDLEKQWEDPAYIEERARQRLQMVKPGETSYQIVGADDAPGEPGVGHGAIIGGDTEERTPWYAKVWSSLEGADSLTSTSGAVTTPIQGGTGAATTPAATGNVLPSSGTSR